MTGRPVRCPGPAGQRAVGAGEGGLPVTPGRGVEDRHAGRGQRGEEGLEFARVLGDAGVVVAALPLGEPERDRELRPGRRADGGGDLGAEPHPARHVAAVAVGPPVGDRPVELVEQVAVRAVQFDAVEPGRLGLGRGAGERGHHALKLGHGGGGGDRVARRVEAGRADDRRIGVGRAAGAALRAEVPELREDRAAFVVHGRGDLPPAVERLVAEEPRHPGRAAGRLVDVGALGDQQAERGRAATVVGRDVIAGNPVRRELPRHRRHREAVAELEPADADRGEQGRHVGPVEQRQGQAARCGIQFRHEPRKPRGKEPYSGASRPGPFEMSGLLFLLVDRVLRGPAGQDRGDRRRGHLVAGVLRFR